MLTQVWNHEELQTSFGQHDNLGQVIKEIEKSGQGQSQVVCRVVVNGLPLTELEEGKFGESKLNEIQTLEIHSSTIHDLLVETAQSSTEYGRNLIDLCLSSAEILRTAETHSAHLQFVGVLEGIDSLLVAHRLMTEVVERQGEELSPAWIATQATFIRLLTDILTAYEKRDFILTADLLEYDFTRALQDYVGVLGEICGVVESRTIEAPSPLG